MQSQRSPQNGRGLSMWPRPALHMDCGGLQKGGKTRTLTCLQKDPRVCPVSTSPSFLFLLSEPQDITHASFGNQAGPGSQQELTVHHGLDSSSCHQSCKRKGERTCELLQQQTEQRGNEKRPTVSQRFCKKEVFLQFLFYFHLCV